MPTSPSLLARRLLLVSLLLLLLLPALQAKLKWLPESPLQGAFTIASHPDFSFKALQQNTYQPNLEKYLEDRIGFRSALIRLRNQFSFSVFGVAHSSELVIGRNDVLFQPNVVDGYLGRNFIGQQELAFRVRRLRIVQDDLAKRHVPLLLLLAPSKARYQAEDLPLRFRLAQRDTTNYEVYIRQCRQAGINVLDATALFQQWKSITPYPLFPKGGTHWSAYGAARIADTLFHRIEAMAGIDLPDYHTTNKPIIRVDSLTGDEDDLSSALNLIWPYQAYSMAHFPATFYPPKPTQIRPNILVVGDSFTWGLINYSPFLDKLFASDSRFWYYFNSVYPLTNPTKKEEKAPRELDLKQEIQSRQFVLLITTEHNLVERDYGFIDQLYELYHPLTDNDNNRITAIGQEILRQPEVQDSIWKESYKSGRSANSLIYDQARAKYDRTERGTDLFPLLPY